jgi:tRNA-specific 2-thiouridylase
MRPVWTGCVPPAEPLDCLVQLRAHGEAHACTAWIEDDAVRIRLRHPARGVAKGQAAVLYDGDTVLGSATISGTSTAPVACVVAGPGMPAAGQSSPNR